MSYLSLHRFLRAKIKAADRSYFRVGEYFVKVYEDPREAVCEYEVLTKIRNSNPLTFNVPKVFKIIKGTSYTFIVMEYVRGVELQHYIQRYLLSKDPNTLRIFWLLGKAFRELHNLNLNGLPYRRFPSSDKEIAFEIEKLTERCNLNCEGKILNSIKNITLDDRIFNNVNLFGEAYFVHIMKSDKKFVFFDLHKACRGPLYWDLATFNESLYSSLLITPSIRILMSLTEFFLKGYFDENIPLKSMSIAELYLVLQSIKKSFICIKYDPSKKYSYIGNVSSLRARCIALFKKRRLTEVIKKGLIPKLERISKAY